MVQFCVPLFLKSLFCCSIFDFQFFSTAKNFIPIPFLNSIFCPGFYPSAYRRIFKGFLASISFYLINITGKDISKVISSFRTAYAIILNFYCSFLRLLFPNCFRYGETRLESCLMFLYNILIIWHFQ